ncbi:hypothetical protein COU80_05970 [Candidatus Peregrinibacteria bacterium CG10_big_fil_rev_8_21_14_0_10_55_24]|nr:MAG: hypothetical protein COU80_05970 [Candidatus Peregrinibacteria bacterium CG10_big_fil_rev_8_21_14_0_10_55_24]
MTYALGWKTENEVYLAADSAITLKNSQETPGRAKSSFGEGHLRGSEKFVEERMQKLLLRNGIGVAFAGNVQLAITTISTFFEEIEKSVSPIEALKWAIGMHNPESTDKKITILIGYHDGNHPHLLTFNSQDDRQFRTDEILVQAGSMPEPYKKFTGSSLSKILPETIYDPRRHIASMLGIFQTYGIVDDLITHGVGGAFSGLWIGKSGGNWQPDIMFVLDDKMVSTCIRENCLLVNSPTIGESRCLITNIPPRAHQEVVAKALQVAKDAKLLHREAKFDFVVIINKQNMTVTLLEMRKNNKHGLLLLEPFTAASGRTGIAYAVTPKLFEIINLDVFFKNIPYMEPTIDNIQDIPADRILKSVIDHESRGVT